MHLTRSFRIACGLAAAAVATHAQTAGTFPSLYTTERVDFTGQYVDYVIPTEGPPQYVDLVVKGGDGGDVTMNGQTTNGGRGVQTFVRVPVGTGFEELAPGGTLRVIAGGQGGSFAAPGGWEEPVASGGGGGSAVLYAAPGGSFEYVVVAGGGGGSWRFFGSQGAGQDGAFSACGSNTSVSGGCNGAGGKSPFAASGNNNLGGGGGGITGAGAGLSGGAACLETGGAGGDSGTLDPRGGWGCGGGGGAFYDFLETAPGGGGGYSGGAGAVHNEGAGGGGTFLASFAGSLPGFPFFNFDETSRDGYVQLTPVRDSDGDGTVDLFDVCFGIDTMDSDGDGLPDACDPCPFGSAVDCNGNGVEDSCDQDPQRMELFNDSSLPASVSVAGDGMTPTVVDNALQLATDVAQPSASSVLLSPVSPLPVDAFQASFYARVEPTALTSEGISFHMIDADQYGPDTLLGVEGIDSGLTVRFYEVIPGLSVVEVLVDGLVDIGASTPFQVDDGQWRRYEVSLASEAITVRAVELDGASSVIFENVLFGAPAPLRARFGFGAASSPATPDAVFLDEVRITDFTGAFDPDLDDDGTLDACEPLISNSITGSPPNPDVLAPTGVEAPVMEETFELVIDHTSFQTGAAFDALYVSAIPGELPFPGFGTILVNWPPPITVTVPGGDPFTLPIPYVPVLFDLELTFQGASYDPAALGQQFLFTNAIRANVAGWQPVP